MEHGFHRILSSIKVQVSHGFPPLIEGPLRPLVVVGGVGSCMGVAWAVPRRWERKRLLMEDIRLKAEETRQAQDRILPIFMYYIYVNFIRLDLTKLNLLTGTRSRGDQFENH